jgi:hypothetical protein
MNHDRLMRLIRRKANEPSRSRKRAAKFLKGDTHARHTHRKKDKAVRLGLCK